MTYEVCGYKCKIKDKRGGCSDSVEIMNYSQLTGVDPVFRAVIHFEAEYHSMKRITVIFCLLQLLRRRFSL